MRHSLISRLSFFAVPAMLVVLAGSGPCRAQYVPLSGPGSANSIPQAQLIQADALNHLLQTKGAEKPLVLQTGSRVLFDQAHIVGSEFVGPGSQAAGLQALEQRVAALPKKKAMVLYCGCCPWDRCPNLGPAYGKLHELGFTNVKVLYLANNFGSDWVNKGYPVERSH